MHEIPNELKNLKREEFISRKRYQQIRNSSVELKELERELCKAEYSMNLALQREEREKKRVQSNLEQRLEHQRREDVLKLLEAEERLKEQEKLRSKKALRSDLNNQICEKEKLRLSKYQELLLEQQRQDYIQKLAQEDEKLSLKERHQQSLHVKRDLLNQIKTKEILQMQEKAKESIEMQKLAEQQLEWNAKILEEQKQRQKKLQQQQEISEMLGKQMNTQKEAEHRREMLMLELYERERTAIDEERLKAKLENERLQRIKYAEELQKYRRTVLTKRELLEQKMCDPAIKEAHEMREREEEAELRENIENRAKKEQYGRDILAMITENRLKRVEDLAESLQLSRMHLAEEQERQIIVKEVRRSMLQERPAEVLRHLRKSVLQKDELQLLPK